MFAYGSNPNTFNIREAAAAPYRGLTALIQGKPYLVIDREGDTFVLEGEEGDILKLQHFDWAKGSDDDKLVAASRIAGSPFEAGSVLGDYVVGNLVNRNGQWFVRIGRSEMIFPLEQMIEVLADHKWDTSKFADQWKTAEMGNEIKWIVQPDGNVIFEDPSHPVPNHLALAAQYLGRDYVREFMTKEGDNVLGIMGVINPEGQIDVGGALSSDPSIPMAKGYDPTGSTVGALRTAEAVKKIYEEASKRGIPVSTDYTIPRIQPGEGIRRVVRPIVSSLQGTFYDHITGDEINFHELDHFPKDSTTGQQEYWAIQGDDGNRYYIVDGDVVDEQDNVIGNFDPYAQPDEDRDLDFYPDWIAKVAASFERNLPRLGIHGRTHMAMAAAGLQCDVTYPPGVTMKYPEGFVSHIPSDTANEDQWIVVDHGDMSDVVVRVDTNDDPQAVWRIIEQHGETMRGAKIATEVTEDETKALNCPNCGSHTLRAFDVDGGEAHMKCLTCNNEFKHEVMTNPEASVKEGYGDSSYLNYPEDPQQQAQVRELLTQIAQARQQGNEQLVRQLQQQLEQMFTTNPGQPNFTQGSMEKHSPGKEHMPGVSPKRNRMYEDILGSCQKEHPDYSLERCKELAARTVNKYRAEHGETKSSIDDCGCGNDKNAKVVNGECTRCGNHVSSLELYCPHCGTPTREAKQSSEDGKHTPGTRVQVEHPKFKGQRGTVVEFKGRDKDLDEEKYHVLLDSGEKIDELSEGHFKKIKSARIDNSTIANVDSTANHFIDSMTFEADLSDYQHWNEEAPRVWWEEEGKHPHEPYGDEFEEGVRAEDAAWEELYEAMHELTPDDLHEIIAGTYSGYLPNAEHLDPEGVKDVARNVLQDMGTSGGNYWRDRQLGQGKEYPPEEDPFTEWPGRHPMGSKQADTPKGGWPKAQQPRNPNGLPEAPKFDGNKTKFPYDPPAQDVPYDEPDLSGGDVECPNCGSNAKSLGELNAREYFRCSNGDCQMEFSLPNSDESAQWGVEDPDELFGQDKPGDDHFGAAWTPDGSHLQPGFRGAPQNTGDLGALNSNCPVCGKPAMLNGVCQNCGYSSLPVPTDPTEAQGRMSKIVDSTGNDLKEGHWYIMHSSEYKVPDVIKIIKVENGKIEAHFESDRDGNYPLRLESSETDKYSFDPYEHEKDPENVNIDAITTESGWKVSRRNFSTREQDELINENPDGRARNFDKLDLDGTHYKVKEESYSFIDHDFLWSP
jgi:hypothetical protein